MSTTSLAWVAVAFILLCLCFRRPVWGVSLYMLTVFMSPTIWWWGKSLPRLRYNFYAAFVLLAIVLVTGSSKSATAPPEGNRKPGRLAIWVLLNCAFVHYLITVNREASWDVLELLLKLSVLFFLMTSVVRDRQDFRILLWTLALGIGYIGYEVTINESGSIVHGRLEGVGVPGADMANSLASLLVSLLPVIGGLYFIGNKWDKLLVAGVAPFGLNVIFLCNSRGGLLSMVFSAVVLLAFARGPARRKAIQGLVLGGFAAFLLMGDPRILSRFETTFQSSEERDNSAASRLTFWKAGWLLIQDHPLGAGGHGFKRIHGPKYLREVGFTAKAVRAVHNGYINEACQWGVQGFILRLLLLSAGIACVRRGLRQARARGDPAAAMMGACLLAGFSAFLVSSVFGDFLDNEWGYWLIALGVAFERIYGREGPAAEGLVAVAAAGDEPVCQALEAS